MRSGIIRTVLIVVVGAALAVLVVTVRRLSKEPLQESPRRQPFTFITNAGCQPCHQEIYAEWQADQHSQAWFNFGQPQDPKRTECNNCHAPLPILEVGIMTLPVIRGERFEEGVGCIECHQNVDHVEGPRPTAEAACNPVQNKAFTESRICHSCHAPHGTFAEMQDTRFAKEGYTCQRCHMPFVERASFTGGPVRKVRSHRMRTQRDAGVLQEAVTLAVNVADGKVRVSLTNVGAAHNVPGEIFNREMFVTTTVLDAKGEEVARHRESIKTVRREQRATIKSTQIKPGETRVYRYDLAVDHGKVRVWVGYKLLFMVPDNTAMTVWEREVGF
ncbi:MAG: cytochrome c3 family protein [Planctomycetota bacterium]